MEASQDEINQAFMRLSPAAQWEFQFHIVRLRAERLEQENERLHKALAVHERAVRESNGKDMEHV